LPWYAFIPSSNYRFPHGNLHISRQADVAAKRRRESAENHVFRLTVLRREKFTFLRGYQYNALFNLEAVIWAYGFCAQISAKHFQRETL
jgi:hypothetical protein